MKKESRKRFRNGQNTGFREFSPEKIETKIPASISPKPGFFVRTDPRENRDPNSPD
jgi:hypothetical protein